MSQNIMVVYQSSTGFTKQYAEWIAAKLGCGVQDVKKVSQSEVQQCDCVIYGGWIMGGMIVGLDKMRKLQPAKLMVFAVGASLDEEETRDGIRKNNQLKEEPFFYMEGGFRFEDLKLPVRMMLKALKKSAAKKENPTKQDRFMAEVLGTSFDHSNQKYVEPLIEAVKQTIS